MIFKARSVLCLASSTGSPSLDRLVAPNAAGGTHRFVAVLAAILVCGVAACAPKQPLQPVPEAPVPVAPTLSPKAAETSFSVHVDGLEMALSIVPAFVLPGQFLDVSASGARSPLTARAGGGTLATTGANAWRWTAPKKPGDHWIHISMASGEAIRVQIFVLLPYNGEPYVGGQRIGRYVANAKEGDPAYVRPQGFVVVTPANMSTLISPHFTLGQFLCKDDAPYPRYVSLRTPMILKLELLLEALAHRGVPPSPEHLLPASTFHVMSGYRTPAYNAAIGNETSMSRHVYGDAADVYLDLDGDGMQDDLNHDGRSTREDAMVMFRIVEEEIDPNLPESMQGGMAGYGTTKAHGPFLHIDTRGKKARW